MEITIRRATIKDAEALSVIAKETFYYTFKGTCTENDMKSFLHEFFNVAVLEKELGNEEDHCYFAEQAGMPVGYIRFMEDYNSFPLMKKWRSIELKRIYVLQRFQGKGIAQQLMDFFMEYVKKNNYEAIWLGVWEYNERAQRFCEKYGFENSGYTHDFPIGETPQTDWWFWKFL